MSDETKIAELKLKNDILGLHEIVDNGRDWMLSLDAAEALAQLGDKRGLDKLINALSDSDNNIRDVAREILEAINDPQGNQALSQLHESPDVLPFPSQLITKSVTFAISKHLVIIKFFSLFLALEIAMLGFYNYLCGDISNKWYCLSMLPYFAFFPMGMYEIPGIIFQKIGFSEYFSANIIPRNTLNEIINFPPISALIMLLPFFAIIIGWFIYFRLMMFGAKVKNPFIFAIIYFLFILLLLGNISGCTSQLSSLN
jgi:hypothetical protein